MKLRHLFYAFAAALPLLVSCQEEKPLDPIIRVNPAVLTLTGSSATVQTIQFTAGRAWSVISKPDWVDAVNPDHGDPSENPQQVTIAIKSNAGNDREGNIVFAIGRPASAGRDFAPLARAAVKVSQPGEGGALTPGTGTKEDPYSVGGVLEYLKTLGNNVNSPSNVYIKGVISKITETYTASGTNGNATFYIKDTAEDTDDFQCYRVKYLGNKKFTTGKEDIKVNDNVVICGKVVNYSGSAGKVTPETVANEAYLYSLNGTSEEGQEQTEITDATVAQFIQSDGNTYYRLTGEVSNFTTGHNSTGNYDYMQFNLTDATGTVIVYGFKDRDASFREWSTKINNGGTVVLTGTYEKYTDKNGNVKNEVMNTTIESFTEGQAPEITAATVAQFIQLADGKIYRLTGKVSNFKVTNVNNKYMQFDLTDDTGTILAYKFKNGEFDKWNAVIKDNGTVTLTGSYLKYKNSNTGEEKDEIENITVESFTKGEDIPAVTGTVSDAVAAADGTPVTINDAIVSAVSTKGYFVTDGSKNVLVYKNAEPSVKIGDKLKIVAKKTTFNSLPEIADITEETVLSGGNNVPYTTIKDLTTSIDSYTATESEYISATGEAAPDGNYWKVTIAGKTKYVSPRYLPATYDLASLSGQNVIITGYVVQISNTYVGIYVNSVSLADPNAKYCRANPTEVNVKADATSVDIKIQANASWTLTARGDVTLSNATGTAGAEVSGQADATVTASFPANESTDTEKVYTLILTCPDASVNETITITQAKAGAAGEKTVTFDFNTATGIPVTTSGSACSATLDGIKLELESGARNQNAQDIRIYKGKKMTISATSASGLISKIEITSQGGSNGTDQFTTGAPSGYTASSATEGTWTGSANKVEFTAVGAQVRMKSITVTYTE